MHHDNNSRAPTPSLTAETAPGAFDAAPGPSAAVDQAVSCPVSRPAPLPVALARCADYERGRVEAAVRQCLDSAGFFVSTLRRGQCVLVKPNLLRAHPLACTHAEVTRALCLCLLEQGLRVTVADSPGFGTARSVAAAVGLSEALKPLGLEVSALDHARPVALGRGGQWGVSRLALECDHVLSVPKVKAHCQMRASLAVKNLFGCVCGLRKAVAHTRQGKDRGTFIAGLLDLWRALPPVSAVADGIVAMHVTGPSGGQPFALGCVGASPSAVALDTALYTLLGVRPATTDALQPHAEERAQEHAGQQLGERASGHEGDSMPLWEAARASGLTGAEPADVFYTLLQPNDFDAMGFVLPRELVDISFQPHRLLLSLCRRIWTSLRP